MTDEDRFTHKSCATLATGDAAASDLVILDRVRKSFGSKIALKDISFSVPARQICGILGPMARVKPHSFGSLWEYSRRPKAV